MEKVKTVPMAAGNGMGHGRKAFVVLAIVLETAQLHGNFMHAALEIPRKHRARYGQPFVRLDGGRVRPTRRRGIGNHSAWRDEPHIRIVGDF